jgi:hypothetical protein
MTYVYQIHRCYHPETTIHPDLCLLQQRSPHLKHRCLYVSTFHGHPFSDDCYGERLSRDQQKYTKYGPVYHLAKNCEMGVLRLSHSCTSHRVVCVRSPSRTAVTDLRG